MMEFVKSQPGDEPVVVEGYFAASPGRVFEAWTNPDMVVKWFGSKPHSLHSADIDLRPGGSWRFVMSSGEKGSNRFEGEYLDVEPDRRLVFSWSHVIEKPDGARDATPHSRVEVDFSPKGAGTYVRLVHSAIRTEDARRGVGSGWEQSFRYITGIFGTD